VLPTLGVLIQEVKKKRGNTISARLQALTSFTLNSSQASVVQITSKTGVTLSSIYKLRAKAISRG